jgi:hypothetical protein
MRAPVVAPSGSGVAVGDVGAALGTGVGGTSVLSARLQEVNRKEANANRITARGKGLVFRREIAVVEVCINENPYLGEEVPGTG